MASISVTDNFLRIKRENTGMTDEVAMGKAQEAAKAARAKVRAGDKVKASKAKAASKKPNWATRLKGKVKKTLKSRHSKAGKAYKEKMKSGKGRGY